MKKAKCVHCSTRVATRPRGLCYSCSRKPGVRKKYPAKQVPEARRSPITDVSRSPLPRFPTQAPAGSLEKMRVMARRAERGESLFHPLDSRVQSDGPRPFATNSYRGGDVTGLEPVRGERSLLRRTG